MDISAFLLVNIGADFGLLVADASLVDVAASHARTRANILRQLTDEFFQKICLQYFRSEGE